MKDIAIYTLTSALHDAKAVDKTTKEFLGELFPDGGYDFRNADYTDFGSHALDLIYVRTGGTEGEFLKILPKLKTKYFYLLTSGKSNSLAASMEILSYLRQQGLRGEILHGSAPSVRGRAEALASAAKARAALRGLRLGVLGKPSDWLISSNASYDTVKEKLGIELVDIPMQEVKDAVASASPVEIDGRPTELVESDHSQRVAEAIPGALKIHAGLKEVVRSRALAGFTIRCFDLLSEVGNTGCLSLAAFNAEGIPAGCEGDVPALLAMTVARALTGRTGFMANPSRMDSESGRIVFAHCTVPLDMVDDARLDTHFESGIGVGIRGHIPETPVTIFKVSGDLSRVFAAEGVIERNLSDPNLCRTQIELTLDDPSLIASYFLTNPIGNHHIIVPGRHAAELKAIISDL